MKIIKQLDWTHEIKIKKKYKGMNISYGNTFHYPIERYCWYRKIFGKTFDEKRIIYNNRNI